MKSVIVPFVLMPATSSLPLKSPFVLINFHRTGDLAYRENDKLLGIDQALELDG